jgi:V8-like Glu-specific endopeptidase
LLRRDYSKRIKLKGGDKVKKLNDVGLPLTFNQLKKLKSIEAEKLEKRIILNLGTYKFEKDLKPSFIQDKEKSEIYRIQTELSLEKVLQRAPFETIKSQVPDKIDERINKQAKKGIRPKYLPIKFLPHRIKLELSQRRLPPIDFNYQTKDELLDKPSNVFPPDDRYIYRDNSFPWCTVGRVDSPLGTGTGVTIGSRLMLTANHAVQWNSDGTAGWIRFRPSYYNGDTPFGEAWATNVIYWIKTTGGDGLSNWETAFDYVVCVLDTRMGDIVGYPGYRSYNDDWNGGNYWQHMGYPTDLSGTERPAFQGGCVISSVSDEETSGRDGYVMGHFNDAVPGHSGGPVWGWWGNEPWPRVVGVQSAEANTPSYSTSGDNEFGGGPALSDLIGWARSHYP